jgi:hypothetical protein
MTASSAPLPRQGQAVRGGQHAQVDPRVLVSRAVEFPDCFGVLVRDARIRDLALPEDVVDGAQAPRAEEGKAALVVVGLIGLVGVDEGEVNVSRLAVSQARAVTWRRARVQSITNTRSKTTGAAGVPGPLVALQPPSDAFPA